MSDTIISDTALQWMVPFCAKEAVRYQIDAPWKHADYVYATDGRVAVRVRDTSNRPEPDSSMVPPAYKVFANFPPICETPLPVLALIKVKCDDCRGRGFVLIYCSECHGTGEVECDKCGHATSCDDCNDGKVRSNKPCPMCVDGKVDSTDDAKIGENLIAGKYLALLSTLKNIRFGAAKINAPVPFTFDALGGLGEGIIMPTRTPTE